MRAFGSFGMLALLGVAALGGGCGLGSSSLMGAGGSGGGSGNAGAGGTGGGATSLGSVSFELIVPSGTTFCDEDPPCTSAQHFWLSDDTGAALTLGPVFCSVDCTTCSSAACPSLAAIQCPAGDVGVAVNSSAFTWDGSYAANSSCAASPTPSGPVPMPVACVRRQFAAPGTYTARFCATPGTLESSPDGGAAQCTPGGAELCTEVAFAYPAVQQIAITLPSP